MRVHSSTSSSNQIVYIRTLPDVSKWRQVLLCTVIVTAAGIAGVEAYARANDYPVMFTSSPELWATQWFKFESSADDQTVVIGASRNKFGIVLDLWEQETGMRPIMLAWPASPPHPVLHQIAEREDYRGTVICGIAPSFSFAHPNDPQQHYLRNNLNALESLRYSLSYHITKPAQRFLNHQFRSFNPYAFSPIELLRQNMDLKNREGIQTPFLLPFWSSQQEDLQDRYLPEMETNEHVMDQVINLWGRIMNEQLFHGTADIDAVLESYVKDVRRIEDRGGKVIFIRHPSSGGFLDFERQHYPRQDFFDRLVEATDCLGIHFEDYPEISNYDCPEWSHLAREDARDYTRKLINIIRTHDPDAL